MNCYFCFLLFCLCLFFSIEVILLHGVYVYFVLFFLGFLIVFVFSSLFCFFVSKSSCYLSSL